MKIDVSICPVCGEYYETDEEAEECCSDFELTLGEEDETEICSVCGKIFEPDDGDGGFRAEDAPGNRAICFECFDEQPCEGCRGL